MLREKHPPPAFKCALIICCESALRGRWCMLVSAALTSDKRGAPVFSPLPA